jgi:DNA-binding SARP family transcriptional activator
VALSVLGPLDLVIGDQPLRIGGPKERIVLAALALANNRVTSIDRLVDAVWSTSPPSSARGQIQKCISSLRRLFGDSAHPGAIKTYPPGYMLEIAIDDLDSERFMSLVTIAREQVGAARLAEASATLRTALGLWRGPAFDGVPSDLVQRGAAVLDNARLAAIEERVRLDLELDQHEDICAELPKVIEEHPLRERLYVFLMLALYRSGRQAEALEVCRQARKTLIDEVGVEPGQELRDLERAILNSDPALAPKKTGTPVAVPVVEEQPAERPVTPRQLPGTTADFVGRERQLHGIERFLSGGAEDGAPHAVRVVAISGRGGVGKSTLAIRVAHEVSDLFPDGHLYADLQRPHGEEQTSRLLARFLRALGIAGSAIPDDTEERAQLYRSVLADKRLLVVLDDVTSEHQVLPLLPGTATCSVIVTSRIRLTGMTGAHWVDVEVFDATKSMELLNRIIGADRVQAEQDAATELVRLCGGLPLALRIAAGRLVSRPQWRISGLVRRLADEARRLDEFTHRGLELRSSIALTYRSLPSQAKRLFRLFALLPSPDFPEWTAAALLDADPVDAEEALAQLVDAQVLDMVEYPGERIRYRFHDLIQIYAHELLLSTESAEEQRAALTRALGAWLTLAELAHRKIYGGDYTILHGSAPRWPMVHLVDEPMDDPIEWWDLERRALVAAVRKAAAEGMDELCWDLALTEVTLFEVKGYFDDWRETAELAHDAARRADNRLGQAAMEYSLGVLHLYQLRLGDAEKSFNTALKLFEAEGNTHGCALVLRNAASVDRLQGRFASMLAKYEESLGMMREVGDVVSEAYILRNIAAFRTDEGDVELARNLLNEALTLFRKVNYRRGEAQVLSRFAELNLGTGQSSAARRDFHQSLRIVRDMGDQIGEAHALYGLGLIRRHEGKLDKAEATLVHALSLARQVSEKLIEGKVCYELGDIELARGNNRNAISYLVKAGRLFGDLGSVLWMAKTRILLAEVHESDGDLARAGQELGDAALMLSKVESKEAKRLLSQLTETRSALLTTDA